MVDAVGERVGGRGCVEAEESEVECLVFINLSQFFSGRKCFSRRIHKGPNMILRTTTRLRGNRLSPPA